MHVEGSSGLLEVYHEGAAMARNRENYRLEIDAFSPETIPMSRLAEYMADLADLLGNQDHVHFVGLEAKSTDVLFDVEWEAIPKVRERISAIKTHDAPPRAAKAFKSLDERLERDNATGVIIGPGDRKFIVIPGRTKPKRLIYGPFNQEGSLTGTLIVVGGEDQMVPVHIEEEGSVVHNCHANRKIARQIAPHIFGPTLRVQGDGRWYRDGDGQWEMRRFTVKSFKVLKQESLVDAVERLRAVESPLKALEDPLGDLEKLREGQG